MNVINTPNRLIDEKSPYLLQHSHNPVDWYPWCDEAFNRANEENKPIFLSIGYSTCHWCHVMERESFEDAEVAKVLNEYFICIKVDREERPDIDKTYMSVCQMLTGSGGWPLSIFMTAEKKPFYAATYLPKHSKMNMMGIIEVSQAIHNLWINERKKITQSTNEILKALHHKPKKTDYEKVDKNIFHDIYSQLIDQFDSEYGGFGQAPKFPMAQNCLFLLRYYHLFNKKDALDMAEKTLAMMYRGGIFDHIGFGFSRYSTDREWLVPHFEKMLYDNALMAIVYTEAYQLTKKDIYQRIAEQILSYVQRVLTHEKGGFYTAEDADSEGVEGKFYVWTLDEINNAVSNADEFCNYYGVTPYGNFEHKNILNLINNQVSLDEHFTKKLIEFEPMRNELFMIREKRIHPYKDDKILTSWNGLMIASCAIAGRVFQNNQYIKMAIMSSAFIKENLFNDQGRLLVRYRDGESKFIGYLEDYAFLSWGLLELAEATGNTCYLIESRKLADSMIELFWDSDTKEFYHTAKDQEDILVSQSDSYDGAIPSGTAIASKVLLKLSKIFDCIEYQEIVENNLSVISKSLTKYPLGYLFSIINVMELFNDKGKFVIAEGENNLTLFHEVLQEKYNPFITKVIIKKELNILQSNPFEEYKPINNQTTLYKCKDYSCQKPINNTIDIIKAFTLDY